MEKNDQDTCVKVAVRIRPQNAREQVDMCRVCAFVTPGEPQVVLGKDKAFTYDYVYDMGTEQHTLYSSCVEDLVEGCFSGLNATVFAYGQTGSGKTYTMGTGFDVTVLPEEQGAVPRAVHHLFAGMDSRVQEALSANNPSPQFELTAQFLELYNEEIIDLFDPSRDSTHTKRLRIHETQDGNIYVDGAVVQPVKSETETLDALKRGALSRSVGSTNMNAQSSRSHAIFTLNVVQRKPIVQTTDGSSQVVDWETLTAKFHFVDLAGSERLKRTGATGERAKEGISINCGLLALGNVISALGDKAKRGCHVPYRDSKLTRLLQDSLGGNSQTLMIACVSPSDRDFMETLNTLKYANRARNIKNKLSVNQDKNSAQMAALLKRVQELELQIQEFQSGRLVVTESGSVVVNDLADENTLLRAENDKLRLRMKTMQGLLDSQSERLSTLQAEKDMMALANNCHDESTGQVLCNEGAAEGSSPQVQSLLQQYIQQIEDLRSQLLLSKSADHNETSSRHNFTRSMSTPSHLFPPPLVRQRTLPPPELMASEVLQTARNDINRLEHELKTKGTSSKSVRWKRRRRVRKRDRSDSPERMSTDIEAWVLNAKSETSLYTTSATDEDEKQGSSDADVNEDDSKSEEEEENDESEEENISWSSIDSPEEDEVEEEDEDEDPMDDTASIATSIAELTTEINIKQQLVDQLEKTQRSLHSLRSQYEEKMAILQMQIRSTEAERDKMIKNLASSRQSEAQEEKMKELREKYESQLNALRQELKQLQIAKREHAIAVKKNIQQDAELRKLKTELTVMKTQKTDLVKQLKKETSVFRMTDQKKEKEIAKLRKDHRKKENIIKSLQADARRKEMILKRKTEEVQALRRQQSNQAITKEPVQSKRERPLTAPPSPYTPAKTDGPAAKKARLQRRQSSSFSSDGARKKWRNMELMIKEVVNRHQTMNLLEIDLDRWVQKRKELSHRADQLRLQKETLLQATEDIETLSGVEEELEALTAQISWTNDSIDKLQDEIVAFEDTKAESDTMGTTALIHSCSSREAKYLLEHLVNVAIESGTQAFQKDAEVKSLKLRLATSEQHAELIKIYSSPHIPQSPLVINSRTVSKISHNTTPTLTPVSSQFNLDLLPPSSMEDEFDLNKTILFEENGSTSSEQIESTRHCETMDNSIVKHRRRTAVPAEIKETLIEHKRLSGSNQSSSMILLPIDNIDIGQSDCSKPGSTDALVNVTEAWTGSPQRTGEFQSSPRKATPSFTKKRSAPLLSMEGASEKASTAVGHAGLSRLSSLNESSSDIRNTFEVERSSSRSTKFLVCTHSVKGHSSGVLTLHASDILLFSGSQDCTAKVWDLSTGQVINTLTRHHSYVRKVTFCPLTQLVFTACQSLIKVWDLRNLHRPEFVKTLHPPPGSQSGIVSSSANSADTVVQDLLVNGNMLLSAAGTAVHVWDMRQMLSVGRLVGHSGSVGTIAKIDNDTIATGSRDRLIKLYDTSQLLNMESGFNQQPQSTLSPAHYDTVSSLMVHHDNLYSSCGVSIKKWNIPKQILVQAVDGAHPQSRGNAITSLDVLSPSMLVSACKSGCLKMWLTDTCQSIGEISAHKMAINSLTVNQYSVFTGSSDKTIKIWRPNTSLFPQQ